MFRILIFTIFTFNCLSASSQAIPNVLNVTISQERYQNQYRPQIRLIIDQYYSFIASASPIFGKDLEEMQNLAVKIAMDWKSKSANCKSDRANCNLSSLYKEANSLDQLILGLQEKFWVHIKPKYDADTLIKVSKYLDEVMIINYKLMHKIEEIHVLSNNFNKPKASAFDEIALIQRNQENNTINLFFNILPEKLKPDFNNLYFNFIKPLEHHAIMENANELLAANIYEYNIILNAFNMNLTKGDIPLTREQSAFLQTIHQTWNSILRSLL